MGMRSFGFFVSKSSILKGLKRIYTKGETHQLPGSDIDYLAVLAASATGNKAPSLANVAKWGAYTVLVAPDGQGALRIAEQHPKTIHLVITDMVMPRVFGYTDYAVLQNGGAEAGWAFIHKPNGPLALARKVRQLLGANGTSR